MPCHCESMHVITNALKAEHKCENHADNVRDEILKPLAHSVKDASKRQELLSLLQVPQK